MEVEVQKELEELPELPHRNEFNIEWLDTLELREEVSDRLLNNSGFHHLEGIL